jgi:PPM family protein phosphatase
MSTDPDGTATGFVTATLSDPGKRHNNEDVAVLVRGPESSRGPDELLFGVVDGMGGYQAGEVASALARDTLQERFGEGGSDVGKWIEDAHTAIVSDAGQHPEREGMGAVLTVGLISGNTLTIGHVGDTRLYRLRDSHLSQLTRDQSAVGELMRAGQLTTDQARTHHMSNVVYQAVGHADRPPEAVVESTTIEHGDKFLVCSDGLTDVITERQGADVMRASATLGDAAEDLIAAALTDQDATDLDGRPIVITGGKDNITVTLVEITKSLDSSTGTELAGNPEDSPNRVAIRMWRGIRRTLQIAKRYGPRKDIEQ